MGFMNKHKELIKIMKNYQFLFSLLLIWVVFSNQVFAINPSSSLKVDQTDELFRSVSSSLQELNENISEAVNKIKEDLRSIRALAAVLKQLKEQSEKLRDQLKEKKEEIEGKIKAVETQLKKLKEQTEKLIALQNKLEELIPTLTEITGQDQSAEKSRQILGTISQDRVKAAKLLEAIKDNKLTEINDLLKQNITGVEVEVREVKNADGATVVFRVGNLIHCLSTKNLCNGKISSLTKITVNNIQNAEDTVIAVKDLLVVINKNSKTNNDDIEEFISELKSIRNETGKLSADLALELQRLMNRLAEATSTSSQISQQINDAINQIIGRISG